MTKTEFTLYLLGHEKVMLPYIRGASYSLIESFYLCNAMANQILGPMEYPIKHHGECIYFQPMKKGKYSLSIICNRIIEISEVDY